MKTTFLQVSAIDPLNNKQVEFITTKSKVGIMQLSLYKHVRIIKSWQEDTVTLEFDNSKKKYQKEV